MGQNGENREGCDQEVKQELPAGRDEQFRNDLKHDQEYEHGLLTKEILVILFLVLLAVIREVYLSAWVARYL